MSSFGLECCTAALPYLVLSLKLTFVNKNSKLYEGLKKPQPHATSSKWLQSIVYQCLLTGDTARVLLCI